MIDTKKPNAAAGTKWGTKAIGYTKEEALENGHCPECGYGNLEIADPKSDDVRVRGLAKDDVLCVNCDRLWNLK